MAAPGIEVKPTTIWSWQAGLVEGGVAGCNPLLGAERDDVSVPEERRFDELIRGREEALEVFIEGLRSQQVRGA